MTGRGAGCHGLATACPCAGAVVRSAGFSPYFLPKELRAEARTTNHHGQVSRQAMAPNAALPKSRRAPALFRLPRVKPLISKGGRYAYVRTFHRRGDRP